MKRMLAVLAAAMVTAMARADSNEPNRVANGGFETGDFSGWTMTNGATTTSVAHTGNFSATLTGPSAAIRQQIFTGSQQYDGPFLITFWLKIDPLMTPVQSLWLRWGGNAGPYIFTISNDHAVDWTKFSFISIGQGSILGPNFTTINFELPGGGSYASGFHLDDIMVQAVPETGRTLFLLALAGGVGGAMSAARRGITLTNRRL